LRNRADSADAGAGVATPARGRRRVTRASVIAMAVVSSLLLSILLFRAFNWTLTFSPEPSLGHYVFLCDENRPKEVRLGDKACFPFPLDTPYYRKGQKFLKEVGCMPGQTLSVDAEKNYYCDGVWLGRARDTDVKGKPVRNFVFSGKVPEGKFFAMGTHSRSYDSRYWGFVDLSSVTGKCYGY